MGVPQPNPAPTTVPTIADLTCSLTFQRNLPSQAPPNASWSVPVTVEFHTVDDPVAPLVAANTINGNRTLAKSIQAMCALLFGRIANVGASTENFYDETNSTDCVDITYDSSSNRTTVTVN